MMSREVIQDRNKLLDFFQKATFWDEFGNSYQNFPWGEYLYCPKCKSFDDYGPKNSYGFTWFQEKNTMDCPICSSRMEKFWSYNRIWHYFEIQTNFFSKQFLLVAAKKNDKYIGLIFGTYIEKRDIPDLTAWFNNNKVTRAFYIDLIFISASFRRSKGIKNIISATLIFVKMIFSPLKFSIYDRLIQLLGNPVIFYIFTELIEQCKQKGVFVLISRTHKVAKNVKFIFRITGFRHTDISSKDDNAREYFYTNLSKNA
ncbi:MAG: hypothetical protein V1907_02500 [Candidatus Kerfeldbacteria bacterium]